MNNKVTITLQEYKDLITREMPNDNDKWVLNKLKDFILDNVTLDSSNREISIKSSYDFANNILKFIKIVDINWYKDIIKKSFDKKMEEEENKLKIAKMNEIKKINKEAKANE